MTMEQYREMDVKLKTEDEERRTVNVAESMVGREWEREEKENITDAESGSELGSNPRKRHAGHSPRLSSRSASVSHIERITSALPARGSMSRAPLQVPGRQILPGPNRAGRILMGAKYGAAPGGGSAGFDKISEAEALDGDLGAVVDFYGGEETYTGWCHASILITFDEY
jgi:serine/threonine-protein kinase TTK/MPS1